MADGSLIHKAETCERVANHLDHLSGRLSNLDNAVNRTISGGLFPTIEGNTANHLHELYYGWSGELDHASHKSSHAAQILRRKAEEFRREYARQEQEDRDRAEKDKKK